MMIHEINIESNKSPAFELDRFVSSFFSIFSVCSLGVIQLIKFLSIVSITSANMMVVAVGVMCLVYVAIKHGMEGPTGRAFMFIIVYTIFGMMSYLYNYNMDLVELLWPLGYMSIGILLLNEGIPLKTSKIMFLIFSCVLLFDIIRMGDVGLIAINFSRNMISEYALLLLCLVFLSSGAQKKGISPLYPIVFAVLCFAAVGRSGIATSVLCIIVFLFFDFSKGKAKIRGYIVAPLSAAVFGVICYLIYKFMPEIINMAFLNIETRGLESQRHQLWLDYLSKISENFMDFLLGAEISGTYLLDHYKENLHNSFLMLHAKYGLVMFISVIFMIGNAIRLGIKTKNIHLLLVIALILFRMNFDYTNFNDCLDCVLIYVLFYNDFLQEKQRFKIIKLMNEGKNEF